MANAAGRTGLHEYHIDLMPPYFLPTQKRDPRKMVSQPATLAEIVAQKLGTGVPAWREASFHLTSERKISH